MDPAIPRKALGAIRIAVGIGAFLAPTRTGTALDVHAESSPGANYVMRMFGARELLLGVLQFNDNSPIDPVAVTRLAIAVDAGDALAALLSGAAGDRPWKQALPSAALACGGVVLGALGVAET